MNHPSRAPAAPLFAEFYAAGDEPIRATSSITKIQFIKQLDRDPKFWTSRAIECQTGKFSKLCPSPRLLSKFSIGNSTRVIVTSGTTVKTFIVRNQALSAASGYFRAALSGRWQTNNHGEIRIEDDPAIFWLFLNYAEFGRLSPNTLAGHEIDFEYLVRRNCEISTPGWPVRLDRDVYTKMAAFQTPRVYIVDPASNQCILHVSTQKPSHKFENVSFKVLVDLYIFADRRDVPDLADLAVSMVLEKISQGGKLPIQALDDLLDHTAQGESGLMFKMLTDIAARFVDAAELLDFADVLPVEFTAGIVQRQREHVKVDQKWDADIRARAYRVRHMEDDFIYNYAYAQKQTFKACNWHLHKNISTSDTPRVPEL